MLKSPAFSVYLLDHHIETTTTASTSLSVDELHVFVNMRVGYSKFSDWISVAAPWGDQATKFIPLDDKLVRFGIMNWCVSFLALF